MKKLKIRFAYRNVTSLLGYVLICIALTIYIVVKKSYVILFILIPILIYFIYKNKTLFFIYITLIFLIFINLILKSYNYYNFDSYNINSNAKIYKVVNFDDYQKVYIKNTNKSSVKFKIYFISKEKLYSSGDIIKISGLINKASMAHTEGGFNYNDYLYYQGINGKLEVYNIEKIDHLPCLYSLHERIEKYINNRFEKKSSQIMLALVIGEKSNLDEDLQDQISKLGIGHLFVISGLHMQIISSICFLLLKKLKIKGWIKNSIVLMVLLFYYWLTYFMVSILRVIISFILNKVFKDKFKLFTPIDKLSINAIIVLIVNPLYLFSYSFLLSYTVVFGILLISRYLSNKKGIKTFFINSFKVSLSSLVISLPIVANISNDVNLLSVVFNLFYIPFVSYILLPLSFITLFIPPLNIIYEFIVNIFLYISSFLSKINILDLSIPKISLLPSIAYYSLYLIFLSKASRTLKRKTFLTFILFIFIWLNVSYINLNNKIYFLDLPKGDCLFIEQVHNVNNILIDTGDVDASELVGFLKRKGIRTISSVFITHADSDHIGGLKSLLESFKIKTIYISCYDIDSKNYIQTLILKKTKLVCLKEKDELKIGKATIKVLWPNSINSNVNYNSLVLLINFIDLNILDVGDLTKEAEVSLINKYKTLKCDILKVGHHASNTSSSVEFLNSIKPKLAVAMNGYNNTFGFPNQEIVSRYNELNITMLNTIDYGSIVIKKSILKKDYKIDYSFNN